tara:strand:- start:1372 stop:1614 length:243 start_codon:yes stop_codon:yes gene_type:complete
MNSQDLPQRPFQSRELAVLTQIYQALHKPAPQIALKDLPIPYYVAPTMTDKQRITQSSFFINDKGSVPKSEEYFKYFPRV